MLQGLTAAAVALGRDASAQPAPWAAWQDLLNALPYAERMNAARSGRGRPHVDMKVQRIEDAKGTHVNFDHYMIDIYRLPTRGPTTLPALSAELRTRLGDFFEGDAATLGAYSDGDHSDWTRRGPAPLGSVMVFRIPVLGPVHEQAAVVTSVADDRRWIFTPVSVGAFSPGEHPVSGNREFGVRSAPGLAGQVYTRAADRAVGALLDADEGTVFQGGDRLWRSFQARVAAYIASHGGEARVVPPVIHRARWTIVRASGLFVRS